MAPVSSEPGLRTGYRGRTSAHRASWSLAEPEMRKAVILAGIAFAFLLTACGEPAAQRKADEEKQAADAAKAATARERAQYSDPARAEREVGRILETWIQVKDVWRPCPSATATDLGSCDCTCSSAPWLVTCERGRSHVTIGPWVEGDREGVGSILRKEINRVRLDDELCGPLSELVGRKMVQMMEVRNDRPPAAPAQSR